MKSTKTLKTAVYWFWHCILPVAFSPCIGFIYIMMSSRYLVANRPLYNSIRTVVCFIALGLAIGLIAYTHQSLKKLRFQCGIVDNYWFTAFEFTPYIILGNFVFMISNVYDPSWLWPILRFSPLIFLVVAGGFLSFVKHCVVQKLVFILEPKKKNTTTPEQKKEDSHV